MIITKFETWWVTRDKCLFDEKRQGGAKMGWDVFAIKLTADDGTEGIATCMAARSGVSPRAICMTVSLRSFLDVILMTTKQSSMNYGMWTATRRSSRYSFRGRWT